MALVGGPLPNPLYHCPRKHTFNVSWKECLKQTQGSYVDPVCFRHSFYCDPYLYFNQFVFLISKTDFYAVFYCGFPVGIRVNVSKVVVVPAAVLFQNASCNNRLGIIGISFSEWQSQFGETSVTRLIWKQGRSFTTAYVYSAILQFKMSLDSSQSVSTASTGQTPTQRPQPTQRL